MKYILVTGGAGFVGSNFIRYIFENYEDYYIINLDKLTYAGSLDNIKIIDKNRYDFYKGDIRNFEIVDSIFKKYPIDYVANFAAESHVDRSLKNPQIFLKTNILGVQNLLEVCLKNWKNNFGNKKFLQISTDEVYGDRYGLSWAEEKTILNPSSPYSASKVSGEMILKAYGKSFGLPYNIVRSSNNYGPNQYKEKLIPLVINKLMVRDKIPLYGDGKQKRDWIYVEDNCRGIMEVLLKGDRKEVYNIGTGKLIENVKLIKILIEKLSEKMEDSKINNGLIEFVEDRPGHDREYKINCRKIKENLNWKYTVELKDGIEKTIDYYLNK
ncbi:MAG: dTDP-glucose 4,6-dehydratase [Eubacteriales bacterium]